MNDKLRSGFKWSIGLVAAVSLLGGCAGPDEQGAESIGEIQDALSPQNRGAVQVSLSTDQATFRADQDVTLTVTLTNNARQSMKLLKWFTPVDGLEEPLFQVTRDGAPVAFEGPHYKRPAAVDADFVKLAPGQSVTTQVSLSGLYDFSQTGNYSIHHDLGGALTSNELKVQIEGRKNVTGQAAGSVCTSTQMTTLNQALSAASNYANGAVTYLSGSASGTPRYTTWFGTFSSTNWGTIKTHFTAIKSAYDNNRITFDCSCRKNYYAYVYPTQPYVIYPCNVFWTAPLTGTDSKAGTLIHETSHFNVVASTDDWAYGQSACKSLAISNPTNARDNADSHEYFAENTPAQQ
jgi:peptidyl-Lys metalloendopeptidase